MSNNILDKGAMRSIGEIEAQMPHILSHLTRISTEQTGMRTSISEMATEQAQIEGRLISIEKTIEEIPSRCPHREAIARSESAIKDLEKLSDRINSVQNDVAGLKTADRIYGGANALIATAISVTVNALNGNL